LAIVGGVILAILGVLAIGSSVRQWAQYTANRGGGNDDYTKSVAIATSILAAVIVLGAVLLLT
jgi:putative Mn2+ efflux pump MntP